MVVICFHLEHLVDVYFPILEFYWSAYKSTL